MKFIIKLSRRIIFSAFLLYGYNLIAVNFNLILPVNVYSIGLVSLLGIPSVFALILFKVLILWGVLWKKQLVISLDFMRL